MPYTNTVVTTSTSGTWNGTSISYNSISLIDGIPHSAQLEVERVFTVPRTTGNYSTIEDFLNNSATTQKDKQQVFIIPPSRITFNETSKTITAIDLPNSGATVYDFDPDGIGLANVPVPGIVSGTDTIKIRRKTVSNQTLVEWSAGSKLTSAQLNLEVKQLIYLIQELIDKTTTEVTVSNTSIGTIPNYSITPTKLSTGGPSWTSGGSVGIGTTNPSQKLHVYGSGAIIRVDNTNATSGDISLITTGGPSASGSNLQVLHETGNSLIFLNSGSPGGNFSFRGSGGTSAAITQTGTLVVGSGTINTNASFPNGLKLETVTAGTDSAIGLYHYGDTDAGNAIRSFRAKGSKASPTAVVSSNLLGSIRGLGYNGSAFTAQTGGMDIVTTENWTTGANGTAIAFNTTTNGSSASSMAERMRIDHSGKVGIGIASPNRPLSVYESSIGAIQLINSTTGSSNTNGFVLSINGLNTAVWNYANGNMRFGTNDTERMIIGSGGNIGIGTDSPSTKLQINVPSTGTTLTGNSRYGGIHLSQNNTNDEFVGITAAINNNGTQSGLLFQNSGAYGSKIHFLTTDSFNTGMQNRMTLGTTGNLGIGGESSGVKLEVITTGTGTNGINIKNSSNNAYGSLHIQGTSGGVASWANGFVMEGVPYSTGNTILSSYTGALKFQTGTSRIERMGISSTGDVSISSSTGAIAYDTAALTVTGGIGTGGGIVALSEIKTMATSNPMASAATTGIPAVLMYSNSIGIYAGDGVPGFTAAKGSLYIRLTGATTNARLYINTTGAAAWAAVTSA